MRPRGRLRPCRPGLRQGLGPAVARHPPRPGRADARLHGDLQRVRRSPAGGGAGRLGPGRSQAAPRHRLRAFGQYPGRGGAPVGEVGRRGNHRGGRVRIDRARLQDRQHRPPGAGLRVDGFGHPGEPAHRPDRAARHEGRLQPAGAAARRQPGRGRGRRRHADQGQEPGRHRRAHHVRQGQHGAAGGARGASRRGLCRGPQLDLVPDRAPAEPDRREGRDRGRRRAARGRQSRRQRDRRRLFLDAYAARPARAARARG